MTQTLCDICGQTLENDKDNSAYVYLEWKMKAGGLQPHQTQDDICTFCTDKVKESIKTLKREAKNGSDDSNQETAGKDQPADQGSSTLPRESEDQDQK